MKLSEIFISLLCNPDEEISIIGSKDDKRLLKKGIDRIKKIEKLIDSEESDK